MNTTTLPWRTRSFRAACSLAFITIIGLGSVHRVHAAQIVFKDFADVSNLQLNGTAAAVATTDGPVLQLTPSRGNQAGSAFLKSKVSLSNKASFSTYFTFRLSKGDGGTDVDDVTGADGIVFVVQTVANNVGSEGGGIGYFGVPQSVGVEFDTWYNNFNPSLDPNQIVRDPQLPDGMINAFGTTGDGNHVAVDFNGALNHLAETHIATPMNNGQIWHAWIDYNGVGRTLEVRLSEAVIRPAVPILQMTADLLQTLGSTEAYVGFTAATGASYNQQDILTWEIISDYQPIGSTSDLVVSKSANPDPVILGSSLTYTVVVTNNGPNAAMNVVVTDRLPPEAIYLSTEASQGVPTFSNGVLIWNVGTLAAGGTATARIVVRPEAAAPSAGCHPTIDVAFVIDTSESIASGTLVTAKALLKKLLGALDVGEEATRVAIVDFGSQASLTLELSGSSGAIQSALESLPAYGGGTDLASALLTAQTELRTHGRAGVPPVVVLVTDGHPNDQTTAEAAADQCRKTGIEVLCAGMGVEVNTNFLQRIASPPFTSHVFMAGDSNALTTAVLTLQTNRCPTAVVLTLCNTVTVTNGVPDPNPANNSSTVCVTARSAGQPLLPNLVPWKQASWPDIVTVATSTNAPLNSILLTTTNSLFVGWNVSNQGTAPTAAIFYSTLYLDGASNRTWFTSFPFTPGDVQGVWPYSLGKLRVGPHKVTVTADSSGAISESNETENSHTKVIAVVPVGDEPPWLDWPRRTSKGLAEFTLFGAVSRTYEILASTNLINWSVVATLVNTNANGLADYADPSSAQAQWYYRARLVK